MQNLNDGMDVGKEDLRSFSKSYSRMSRFVSAIAAKKSLVVLSEAMPEGVEQPDAAVRGDELVGQLGEDGVEVDVALAGERVCVATCGSR